MSKGTFSPEAPATSMCDTEVGKSIGKIQGGEVGLHGYPNTLNLSLPSDELHATGRVCAKRGEEREAGFRAGLDVEKNE